MQPAEIDDILSQPGDDPPSAGIIPVGEVELIARRRTLDLLMMNGADRDQLIEAMRQKHNMSPAATLALCRVVLSEWVEEEKERRPINKQSQVKRLHRHIIKASAKDNWNAVANLEKVMMMVQGNAEPLAVSVSGGQQLNQAVLAVIGNLEPAQLAQLIAQERECLVTEGYDVPLDTDPKLFEAQKPKTRTEVKAEPIPIEDAEESQAQEAEDPEDSEEGD